MAFLKVENLKKSFGRTKVLKNISFELNYGEVLSIIGSSGNGKTTLLRCLNFLERAESGEIYLNDNKIFSGVEQYKASEKTITDARLHFGLVFQSFNLFPQYSAFENIKLPLALMEKNREKSGKPSLLNKSIDETVMELLSKVGLVDKAKNYPGELSGGQQQRVAIARAMALKPDILCFDEPTSALDPELTGEVLKVIKELKEAYGITMIIVTHEMQFAKEVSDKIMFMSDGIIEDMGTPNYIFEQTKNEKVIAFLDNYKKSQQIK